MDIYNSLIGLQLKKWKNILTLQLSIFDRKTNSK